MAEPPPRNGDTAPLGPQREWTKAQYLEKHQEPLSKTEETNCLRKLGVDARDALRRCEYRASERFLKCNTSA